MTYYESQFERLGKITEFGASVAFSSENGKTNHLTLNEAEMGEVKAFFLELERKRKVTKPGFKSLNNFKKTICLGDKIVMTRHDWYPNSPIVGIERTVHCINSNSLEIIQHDGSISYLYFDRGADSFIFDGTRKFSVVLNPDSGEGLMTYEVK